MFQVCKSCGVFLNKARSTETLRLLFGNLFFFFFDLAWSVPFGVGEEEGGGYLVPVFYFNQGRDVTQYMYVIQIEQITYSIRNGYRGQCDNLSDYFFL